MAKAQSFELRAEVKVPVMTGQALRVYQELEKCDGPVTGVELNERIEKSDRPFRTRQDSLRITLYYLVIFKGKGYVTATRPSKTVAVEVERDFIPGECSELA